MNRLLAPFILALSFGCFGLTTFMPHASAPTLNSGVIAFNRFDGNIYLYDLASKQETQITHFDDDQQPENMRYGSVPAFSPDGKQIAFALGYMDNDFGCGIISVMDANGEHIRRLNEKATTAIPISWSPDGKSILYSDGCSFSGNLASTDVNSGEITVLHSAGLLWAQFPVWSPDGKQIAYLTYSTEDSDIAIADPTADDPPVIIDDTHNNFAPSWSPDGTQIVFFAGGETEGNLYIVDVQTQKTRQLTYDTDVYNTLPSWSPDGKWIAFFSGTTYGGSLYVIDTEGKNRSLLIKHIQNFSWKPQ